MNRICSFVLLLPLLTSAWQGFAQASSPSDSPSGLAILQQVSRHYADAKSYRIESVEELTTTNAFERDWHKTLVTAAEAPGNRYRYEGHSNAGGSLRVSDGATIWTYHIDEGTFTRTDASAKPSVNRTPLAWSEAPLLRAQTLRKQLADFASHYNSAERLPDATLDMNGLEIPCYVVRVKSGDMKRALPNHSSDQTLWIDKIRGTILKSLDHTHILTAGAARIPTDMEVTITYPVAELDAPMPDTLFTFTPPPDAKLLESFPNPLNNGGGVDFTGRTLPSLKLKSGDGKLTSLDSFRGRPVFIDVWATWCGPCVASLPRLAQLYQETKDKGLAFLTIDTDEDARTSAALLAKHGYTWPNFHDDGNAASALGVTGIPRTLLVDTHGTVVFDRMAFGEDELRSEIAKLGPEFAALAPKVPQAPCTIAK